MRIVNYHVFYSDQSAYYKGERRHAQIVMRELAEKNGWKITGSLPQSIFDGWEFRFDAENKPELPSFIRFMKEGAGDLRA